MTRDIGKYLTWLLGIGAIAAGVVYSVYIYNFAPGRWFKTSSDPADWGVFGDYVGGMLNPVFSFLAFVGVLITVMLQAKQLKVAREQSTFEEIQRVMSTISARVDSLLAAAPRSSPELYRNMALPPKSVFELVSALGTWQLNKHADPTNNWEQWAITDEHLRHLQQSIAGELTTICLDLEALAWTLNQYNTAGGSAMVIEFYKYRYRSILTWLDSMDLIEIHGQIQTFFKPKESHQYMVNNPVPSTPRK